MSFSEMLSLPEIRFGLAIVRGDGSVVSVTPALVHLLPCFNPKKMASQVFLLVDPPLSHSPFLPPSVHISHISPRCVCVCVCVCLCVCVCVWCRYTCSYHFTDPIGTTKHQVASGGVRTFLLRGNSAKSSRYVHVCVWCVCVYVCMCMCVCVCVCVVVCACVFCVCSYIVY